jgi:hypothetical protein
MLDPSHDASFEELARRWSSGLIATIVRAVHDPVLAYDVSTEVVAAARYRWTVIPSEEKVLADLLEIAVSVLSDAAATGRVPAVERRRHREPPSQRLTVADQREIAALAEHVLELPPAAREAAEALVRTAPAPHAIRNLKRSGLVDAEPLPARPGHRDAR